MLNKKILETDAESVDATEQQKFLSLLSHQLRVPLTTIKFISEGMLSHHDGLDDASRKKLQSIKDADEVAISIVNDMLDASKFSSKEMAPTFSMCGLKEIIQTLVEMLRPMAAAKNQQIVLSIPEDIHMVKICNDYLVRACQNILDNAVSYADEGSDITVKLSENELHDSYVVMVHNWGPIIPKSEMPKLFQKFYRVPGIEKLKPVGTGLGLYIAKEAIELNGGKIWIESEEGKGTTVTFTVPFKAPRA